MENNSLITGQIIVSVTGLEVKDTCQVDDVYLTQRLRIVVGCTWHFSCHCLHCLFTLSFSFRSILLPFSVFLRTKLYLFIRRSIVCMVLCIFVLLNSSLLLPIFPSNLKRFYNSVLSPFLLLFTIKV